MDPDDETPVLTAVELLATRLLGDADRAQRWLRSPHDALGGRAPAELLATEQGRALVEESLYAIAHGGVG